MLPEAACAEPDDVGVYRDLDDGDGADRRVADQVGQAADHAAGALVQAPGLGGQRAGLVAVQPQGGLQRRDELGPLVPVGERAGADQLAAPSELPAGCR